MPNPKGHPRRRNHFFAPDAEQVFISRFDILPPPRLFHYTTQAGFDAIIRSKSFWATDVRYLNDSAEYIYAVELAIELIQSAAKAISHPGTKSLAASIIEALSAHKVHQYYVFSLSEDGDSLSQWRSYTKPGPGYALGFATEDLKIFCEEGGLVFGKCLYPKEEAHELISELASSFLEEIGQYFPQFEAGEINQDLISVRSRQFAELFLKYAAFIKNPAFEQEKEWRIIASSAFEFERSTNFRLGPHSIVPYVTLEWHDVSFLLALRDAVIKPTPHMELAEQAIHSFIKSEHKKSLVPDYDIKNFEVRRSAIPYREGS